MKPLGIDSPPARCPFPRPPSPRPPPARLPSPSPRQGGRGEKAGGQGQRERRLKKGKHGPQKDVLPVNFEMRLSRAPRSHDREAAPPPFQGGGGAGERPKGWERGAGDGEGG